MENINNMQIDLEEQKIFTKQYSDKQGDFAQQLLALQSFLESFQQQLCPELKGKEIISASRTTSGTTTLLLQQYIQLYKQELQDQPLNNRQELLKFQLTLLQKFERFTEDHKIILKLNYGHIQHETLLEVLDRFQNNIHDYRTYIDGHRQYLQQELQMLKKPVEDNIIKLCLDFGDNFIISKEVYNGFLLPHQNSGILNRIVLNHIHSTEINNISEQEYKYKELEKKYEELTKNIERRNSESVTNYLAQIQGLKNEYDVLNGQYIELKKNNHDLENKNNELSKILEHLKAENENQES
ncbi:3801_t:CDS:2, partial [Scutellospora calospora]